MKRPTEAAACGSKHSHNSRESALAHLGSLYAAGAPAWRMQAYRCRYCACWHVGHRIGSGRRR